MTVSRETMRRLFFALWPSDELRLDIERETCDDAQGSGGRVIPSENLHVTLAFLGSVPEARLAIAVECARALEIQPFELVLGELKWWARQRLLCLEPTAGIDALENLAGQLQTMLRAKHFSIEKRVFHAHITLARDVFRPSGSRLIKELCWQVNRVALVESRTSPGGSIYSVLPT